LLDQPLIAYQLLQLGSKCLVIFNLMSYSTPTLNFYNSYYCYRRHAKFEL
jgi:hypothetical protein